MGDEDGALGMLEEVIADGSPDQQAVARRILNRLENGGE
jgi:FimV-like protein